jgi:hypothetical protein
METILYVNHDKQKAIKIKKISNIPVSLVSFKKSSHSFCVQNVFVYFPQIWFKPGLDPNWTFLQIPHRFLNICVPIKTPK